MPVNHEYIEAMKREQELHKKLLAHGEVTFRNDYNGGLNTITIKFISYRDEQYYVAENYRGDPIEIRKLTDITR